MLIEALASAVSQTYRPVEVTVVDDGSTDDSGSIRDDSIARAAAQGVRLKWIWQNNQGVSAARNTGLRNSEGKYIVFHDSDDILDVDRVGLQVSMLESTAADVCAGSTAKMDYGGTVLSSDRPAVKTGALLSDMEVKKIHWGTQTFMFRRSALENVWWDESLSFAEDTEYMFRVFQRKLKICCQPDAITFKRVHNQPRLSVVPDWVDRYLRVHGKMLSYYRDINNREMIVEQQAMMLKHVYRLYMAGENQSAVRLYAAIKPCCYNSTVSVIEAPALMINNVWLFCMARKANTAIGRALKAFHKSRKTTRQVSK